MLDNHEWLLTYYYLIHDIGCPKCSCKLKITQEEAENNINEICLKKNYILLKPFKYINTKKTKLYLKCNKDNYEWLSTYDCLISGRGCYKCSNKRKGDRLKLTQEEVERKVNEICLKKNYVLTKQFNYIDSKKTKIYLRCNKDNHEWSLRYNDLMNNKGCPNCNISKGEDRIKELLEINNIKYIYQYHNKKILDGMSLDFYLPNFRTAIEYQGQQHFKSINFFGGEKGYKKTVERDNRKYNACNENNIKILYFTNEIKLIPTSYIDKIYTNEEDLINKIKEIYGENII